VSARHPGHPHRFGLGRGGAPCQQACDASRAELVRERSVGVAWPCIAGQPPALSQLLGVGAARAQAGDAPGVLKDQGNGAVAGVALALPPDVRGGDEHRTVPRRAERDRESHGGEAIPRGGR
jgi:hypothetical protein